MTSHLRRNARQYGSRPGSIRPAMTKAGHAANRLTEEQFKRLLDWLSEVQFPEGSGGPRLSQKAIGAKTGVQQSFVHNLMTKKINTTVGTARTMLLAAGVDPRHVLGTEGAVGRYEERDTMSTRGQVLDALSAFYDEEFLVTCQSMTPPPGSERWSHHRWNRHVVELRELWESGHLSARKLPRGKRT